MPHLQPTGKFIQKLVIIIAGSLVYGLLNKLLSSLLLPGADIIAIRPQLILPIAASLLLGPFTGGFIGLFGNLFGDLYSGYGFQFWHWSVANFLIGFIPGTVKWFGIGGIKNVNQFALVLLFVFLGNALGLLFGFIVHILLSGQGIFLKVMYSFYIPALISNTYLLMLLLPPVLILTRFLKLNIETLSMFFLLLFNLLIITALYIGFISVQDRMVSSALASLPDGKSVFQQIITNEFRWVGIILVVIVITGTWIGFYFSRRYMQPINRLAEASDKIRKGCWEPSDKIDPVKSGSEMKNLIGIFNEMSHEIQVREVKMKNTIRELKLMIDKEKEDRIISEITETDFFRQLEKKSAALRKNKK